MAINPGVGYSFEIVRDDISPNFEKLYPFLRTAIHDYFEEQAVEIQAQMQHNAPWNDITGDARRSLTAYVETGDEYWTGDDTISIIMTHEVYYVYYLELRWQGRYAIVLPTLIDRGPQVMYGLRNIFDRMENP